MALDLDELLDIVPLAKDAFMQTRDTIRALRKSLMLGSESGRRITQAEYQIINGHIVEAITSLAALSMTLKEHIED